MKQGKRLLQRRRQAEKEKMAKKISELHTRKNGEDKQCRKKQ